MSVVFVVGAGASRHMRAPVMADFFEAAEDLEAILDNETRGQFVRVREARSRLQATLAKARFDLKNLETVFAAFEMAELLDLEDELLGGGEPIATLRAVIATTLEERMRFPCKGSPDGSARIDASDEYKELVSLVCELNASDREASILTFNYDLGIDVAIHRAKRKVDYFSDASPEAGWPPISLLKLHGSINWFRCGECGELVVHAVNDILNDATKGTLVFTERTTVQLRPSRRQKKPSRLTHCSKSNVSAQPALVPPTLQKLSEHKRFPRIWRQAAARLKDAKYLVIIGYSWPPNDQFFHHLFALGAVGQTLLRRVIIVDRHQSTIDHIKTMLGEDLRDRIVPLPGDFDVSAVKKVREALALI